MELADRYGDENALTYNKDNFRNQRYFFFLSVVSNLVVMTQLMGQGIRRLLSYLPFIGPFLDRRMDLVANKASKTVTNVIGDLVAYSVTDAKSKYYKVRRLIINGSVDALKSLLEAGDREEQQDERGVWAEKLVKREYPAVLVAGHSLGSVVAFDAVNRINLIVNACQLPSYDKDGNCQLVKGVKLSNQLRGFITFGSPLDKVAFFMRENVPEEQWLRQQLVNDYIGFKLRDLSPWLSTLPGYFKVENYASRVRLLDDIPWRNYHDKADYVSGIVDYYTPLTNVACQFKTKGWLPFTHGDYWSCAAFYEDIIRHFLLPPSGQATAVALAAREEALPEA